MSRPTALIALAVLVVACGGVAPTPTGTPRPTATATATAAATGTGTGELTPEQLCAFLPPSDWQQFNYVTTAQPEVESDEPGTAFCSYAQTLTFEIYTHASASDAEETYDTIIENAPFDAGQSVTIAGADEAEIDMQISDDTSGIVVRAGRVAFTIGGPDREEAEAQLQTIATSVVGRIASIR